MKIINRKSSIYGTVVTHEISTIFSMFNFVQENPDLADVWCFGTSTIPRIWDPFRKTRVEKLVRPKSICILVYGRKVKDLKLNIC